MFLWTGFLKGLVVTRNYFFASKGRWLSSAGLYMLTPPDP
jgi:hypothetical protein